MGAIAGRNFVAVSRDEAVTRIHDLPDSRPGINPAEGPVNRIQAQRMENGVRTSQNFSFGGGQFDFLHARFVGQPRILGKDARSMEGRKPEPSLTCQTLEPLDLARAERAMPVVNQDVFHEQYYYNRTPSAGRG